MQKNEDAFLSHTPYTKINPIWIKNLNVKVKTIKLLEEKIGTSLCRLELGNSFLDMTPKDKQKKDKLNFINIILFSRKKRNIHKKRKYLRSVYLMRNMYLEHKKNSHISRAKKVLYSNLKMDKV